MISVTSVVKNSDSVFRVFRVFRGFCPSTRGHEFVVGDAKVHRQAVAGADGRVVGEGLLSHNAMVYLALALVPLSWWVLFRTRFGLRLRAVGENDLSAHSIGYNVIGVRYAAIAFGGAMAGIGGAYFSLVITPMWAERMTAGRGWIALALVVFASWKAPRLLVGAYFFGILMWLELNAKAGGLSFIPGAQAIPSQFWAAMPYLMTVVVLTLISMRNRAGLNAPACLGKPFLPAT